MGGATTMCVSGEKTQLCEMFRKNCRVYTSVRDEFHYELGEMFQDYPASH